MIRGTLTFALVSPNSDHALDNSLCEGEKRRGRKGGGEEEEEERRGAVGLLRVKLQDNMLSTRYLSFWLSERRNEGVAAVRWAALSPSCSVPHSLLAD